jgi:predicted nucleic acid-binding protein
VSSFIVDASVAVKWVVDEEGSDAAAALADRELAAPEILLGECANALWAKSRLREITPSEASERLDVLCGAPVELVAVAMLVQDALRLALLLDHPVYDCLYLALALQREIPLITADRRCAEAASRVPEVGSVVRLLGQEEES